MPWRVGLHGGDPVRREALVDAGANLLATDIRELPAMLACLDPLTVARWRP